MVDQASHPLRDVCLWLGEKVFNQWIIYVHDGLYKWRIEEVNLAENRTALDFDVVGLDSFGWDDEVIDQTTLL